MTLSLPKYKTNVTEEQIQELSVADCLRLREEVRSELQRYNQTNPGVLSRFLNRINERLFEVHYDQDLETSTADEG